MRSSWSERPPSSACSSSRPFGCRDDLAEQITQQAHILAQRRRLVPARRVHRCPPASAVSKALPVVPNPLLEITSASGVPSVCLIPGYASPSWRSLTFQGDGQAPLLPRRAYAVGDVPWPRTDGGVLCPMLEH